MAKPLNCDLCEVEPAVLMVTNINDGDTLTVGANCVAPWAMAMAGIAEGPPEQPEPPAPKSNGRKTKAIPAPPEAEAEAEAPTSVPS